MILTTSLLFLIGALVSAEPSKLSSPTEIIIEKHGNHLNDIEMDYMPSSRQSPFISNFIQKGTNIFFKPQFMLSSSQLPPQIQDVIAAIEKNCKVPLPIMSSLSSPEEPLRIIEKEIHGLPVTNIKEIIEIKPAEFAVNSHEILEEYVSARIPLEVIEHVKIPKAPVLPPYVPDIFVAPHPIPAVIKIEEPVFIPSAPKLPPFTPPKLPVHVEVLPSKPDCPETELINLIEVEETKEITKPSVSTVIPFAPILPPFEKPSLPVVIEKQPLHPIFEIELEKHIEIPSAPVLPPFSLPKLPSHVVIEEISVHDSAPVPCEIHEIVEVNKPKDIIIPPAPVLPPVELQEILPASPKPIVVEFDEFYPANNLVIPPAPILPPHGVPEFPVVMEKVPAPAPVFVEFEHNKIPSFPEWPAFELSSNHVVIEDFKPISIPQPPVLPPFSLPHIPAPVVVEESFVSKAPAVPCEPSTIVEVNNKPLHHVPILPALALNEFSGLVSVEEHNSESFEMVKPIPLAPVLPPLKKPAVTVSLQELEKNLPCPEDTVVVEPRPILIPIPVAFQELSGRPMEVLSIPTSPMFPEWLMPYIPELNLKKEYNIPENNLSSLTSCVHDIVVDRILSKNSVERHTTSSGAPVPFAYLPTMPISVAY